MKTEAQTSQVMRQARLRLHVTQFTLSRRVGCSESQITKIETGRIVLAQWLTEAIPRELDLQTWGAAREQRKDSSSHPVPPQSGEAGRRMNSRDEGKRGEREFASLLREHGFDARRRQQFSGGVDSSDEVSEALAWLHVEVRRVGGRICSC